MGFASRGKRITKTRTIVVDGEKITIKSRNRTWYGNPCGFHVWINDTKYFKNVLKRDEAEDIAFACWVKENK